MAKKRQVFFSFHYAQDCTRVMTIRNIGTFEDDLDLSVNEWESIKNLSHKKIKEWIDSNLRYRSCTIVLIGEKTAHRKWVKYEIKKSWKENKGLFGIYIHNLKDLNRMPSTKGENPFAHFQFNNGDKLSSIVKCYDPPFNDSKGVYNCIKENIETWVEKAIENRINSLYGKVSCN